MTNNEDYVLEILLDTGLITQEQLNESSAAVQPNESVVEMLICRELVTREDVLRALAGHSSMEYVDHRLQYRDRGHPLDWHACRVREA